MRRKKILRDFEIQTDHLIPIKNQMIEKRELFKLLVLPYRRITEWKIKENEKNDECLDLARQLNKDGTWNRRCYQL